MPPPPDSSVLTRFVLENPWPLGLMLLLAAGIVGWMGFREGQTQRQRAALILGMLGAGVVVAGMLVVTAGERAKTVARALVDAAAAQDGVAMMALFADDATLAIGSPSNPGFGINDILAHVDRLNARYTIDSNSITALKGHTEAPDVGIVHLACLTAVEGYPYPTPSQWVLRVQPQDGSDWKITQITCVTINGQTPGSDLW